jgi:type II secretory pathway pseudopilin PulG
MKDYNLKQSMIVVAVGCGLLLIGLYLFTPIFGGAARGQEETTRLEEVELANAVTLYQTAFQQYPAAENASLTKALDGSNPQQLIILKLDASSTNAQGELIDLWGTPYRFAFNSTNSFTITSAGSNRAFGDNDDIVFDSNSNPPVKP